MLKSFKSKDVQELYCSGVSKSKAIPNDIKKRLLHKLIILDSTVAVEDLRIPPSNNLEKLVGNLKDFYSIRINKQYRLIFRFENENAYDVYIDDYH